MDKHIIHRRIWLRAPLVALTLTLALLALLAATVRAGEFPHERKGLVLGFNLGGGNAALQYDLFGTNVEREIENVFGGGGRIGYGLSDHVVLSLEGHGFGKTSGEADVQAVMTLVTVTWYPGGGGFFLRAGGGGGAANVTLPGPPAAVDWNEREAEGAAGVGLGYEWRLGRQFALGVALDARGLSFEDLPLFRETTLGHGTASLQLNWYL
ncbi:hypothetical protein KJ554_00400 [bacterium]|nr:hypothetical protein [bacterium]